MCLGVDKDEIINKVNNISHPRYLWKRFCLIHARSSLSGDYLWQRN
jgi:hypothetical protein